MNEINCVLDQEDINFLEDLIEELPKIDNEVYKTESVELENILYRLTNDTDNTNFQRINFKCSVCGGDSWMEVNLKTYIVSITDLICDDCNPEDDG